MKKKKARYTITCQGCGKEFVSYTTAKDCLQSIEDDIAQRNYRKSQIPIFLSSIEQQKRLVETVNPVIWNTVIDKVTIYSKERIVFKFKGGMEVTRGGIVEY